MLVRRWIAKIIVPAAISAALSQARADGLPGLVPPPLDYKTAEPTNPDGDFNGTTVSAYDPSLSDSDLVEIAVAKVYDGWGKRGSVGIYFPAGIPDAQFPGGQRHFLFGEQAEHYIRQGAFLRGMTTVGMPVDDFGSANWGKNVSNINVRYAITQAVRTPVFQDTLAAIAKDKPELAEAAAKAELTNGDLLAEIGQRAQGNEKLAATWAMLMKEMMTPMAFVVNGFGANNDRGPAHYGVHKRKANELRLATDDDVVAKKVAGLVRDWWKAALPMAKAAGMPLRFFTANHCAGTYEDGDWLLHLDKMLRKEDPALAREVMRRTYSYDLGAGANKPRGVHHLVEIGPRDMFGQINTTNEAMAEAKMVDAGHMINKSLGEVNTEGLKALPLKAFHEAFDLPLYSMARTSPSDPRAFALARMLKLRDLARQHRADAAEQARLQADLDKRSPGADKIWGTYRMAVANLKGNQAIETAQARRALALAHVQKLKAQGASFEELNTAWSAVADAKRDARLARTTMKAEIGNLGFWRTLLYTDPVQYKNYVHGGQETAKAKLLEQEKAVRGKKAELKRQQKATKERFATQSINFYGRAKTVVTSVRNEANAAAAGKK